MYINIKFLGSDVCFYGENIPSINQGLYFEVWFNIKKFNFFRTTSDPLNPEFFLRRFINSGTIIQESYNSLLFFFNEFEIHTGESAYQKIIQILESRLFELSQLDPSVNSYQVNISGYDFNAINQHSSFLNNAFEFYDLPVQKRIFLYVDQGYNGLQKGTKFEPFRDLQTALDRASAIYSQQNLNLVNHITIVLLSSVYEANRPASLIDTYYTISDESTHISIMESGPNLTFQMTKGFVKTCTPGAPHFLQIGNSALTVARNTVTNDSFVQINGGICNLVLDVVRITDTSTVFLNTSLISKFIFQTSGTYLSNNTSSHVGEINLTYTGNNQFYSPEKAGIIRVVINNTFVNTINSNLVYPGYVINSNPELSTFNISELNIEFDTTDLNTTKSSLYINGVVLGDVNVDNLTTTIDNSKIANFTTTFDSYPSNLALSTNYSVYDNYTLDTGLRFVSTNVTVFGTADNGTTIAV